MSDPWDFAGDRWTSAETQDMAMLLGVLAAGRFASIQASRYTDPITDDDRLGEIYAVFDQGGMILGAIVKDGTARTATRTGFG